jgi:hypothetical protein
MTGERTTRWLLICGLLAGPLFTLVYLLEGATRDEGYSSLRHPVSSLALGRHGWMQVANFLATGGLLVAFGVGASRALHTSGWLPRVIAGVGLGFIGAGVFATDPIGGYPPGTPPRPAQTSSRGALHQFFSSFVFFGMPAAFIVEARRGSPIWAAYSITTCGAFIGMFAASSAGFGQAARFANVGGLLQRLALTTGFVWLSLHATLLFRRAAES